MNWRQRGIVFTYPDDPSGVQHHQHLFGCISIDWSLPCAQTHPAVNCISFTGGDTGISISKKAGMVPIQVSLQRSRVLLIP